MRSSGAAALLLTALSGTPCPAGDEPQAPPGVVLPNAGSFGSAPTGAGTTAVTIAADGQISIGASGPLSLESLRALLASRATEVPEPKRDADGSSTMNVVLRADAAVPCVVALWAMQICADPRVRVHRVFVAVGAEDGGAGGAIAAFLPKDRSGPGGERPSIPTIKVRLGMEGPAADPATIVEKIGWMGETALSRLQVEIDATGSRGVPPMGHLVGCMDVLLRSGVRSIVFTGAPISKNRADESDASFVPRRVTAWKAAGGTPGIKVGLATLSNPPAGTALPTLPPGRRVAWEYGSREPEVGTPREEPPDGGPPTPDVQIDAGEPSGDLGSRASEGPGHAKPTAANEAVLSALLWLKAHQSPDGSWEAQGFSNWCDGKPSEASRAALGAGKAMYDVGVTGLALLAFLGAGYTNRSDDATGFGKVVGGGLRFLKSRQDAEGCIGPRNTSHYVYSHAIASLAMVEAYGMTGSVIYKNPAQKALDFIALSRNPYFAWRYGVKPGDNDTSVTGWMMMALHSARMIGLADERAGKPKSFTIDEDAFEGIRAWIDKMTDPDYGRVGYQMRGTGPARPTELVDKFPAELSESMTGIGIYARILLGESPKTSEQIRKGADLCLHLLPTWNPEKGSIDMYYWHVTSLAMVQIGGASWKKWWKAMEGAALSGQVKDGEFCGAKGSWDPIDPWGRDGGRVYSTAIMALCLEAPYRYPLLSDRK